MATASPPALLAVQDRPVAERPEAKGTDGSDGQFAGLMARYAAAPNTTRAADPPASGRPARPKDRSSKAPEANTAAPPATQAPPSPDVQAKAPTRQAQNSGPKAADPVVTGATTPVLEGGAAAAGSPAAGQDATASVPGAGTDGTASVTGLPNALASTGADQGQGSVDLRGQSPLLMAGGFPPLAPRTTAVQGEAPSSSAATALADGQPQTQGKGQVWLPSAEAPTTSSSAAGAADRGPDPTAQALAKTAQQALAAGEDTPLGGAAPTTGGAPAMPDRPDPLPASQVKAPAGSLASSQAGQASVPTSAQIQAVLAESSPRSRDISKAANGTSPASPVKADATSPLMTLKVVGELTTAQNPNPSSVQGSLDPALSSPGPESSSEPGTSSAQPSLTSELVPILAEAPAAKAALATQTPTPHAPDGSALAALSSVARTLGTPASAATAQPLAPAPAPSAPVLQVEGGLRWMLKGGAQEAQLQLHPDSLGQVTIHLKVEGGEVHARLWVTEPGSMQAVQEGRPHLEAALREQGLQLGSFDLQQGNRPFQEAPSAPALREPTFPEAVPARQEAPAALPASILNPHHVELYA